MKVRTSPHENTKIFPLFYRYPKVIAITLRQLCERYGGFVQLVQIVTILEPWRLDCTCICLCFGDKLLNMQISALKIATKRLGRSNPFPSLEDFFTIFIAMLPQR